MRLNQVLPLEKGERSRSYNRVTEIDKDLQKPALLSGLTRTYKPRAEDGDPLPPESQLVQRTVTDALAEIKILYTNAWDLVATKEVANCSAKADIIVNGETIAAGAPSTFLLFLHKQLTDLRTVISRLPVLDPSEVWRFDDNVNAYVTEPIVSVRTKKEPRVLVKYEATVQHPAQTEVYTEDVPVGDWTAIKFSGALPAARRVEMLTKVQALLDAVDVALQEANSITITEQNVSGALLGYIFG